MPTLQDPWRVRVWREFHADNLTRAFRDVLLTLATFRGAGGAIYPSHSTLADRVGCSVRTVQRALAQAAQLGLVSWVERRVRAAWRWLRTSNVYRLLTPAEPVQPGQRAPRRPAAATTGQPGRGGESLGRKQELLAMLAAAAAMPDLLARRRAAMAAQMGGRTGTYPATALE